jgi:hypothetical protein
MHRQVPGTAAAFVVRIPRGHPFRLWPIKFFVTPNTVSEVLGFLKHQASGNAKLRQREDLRPKGNVKSPGKKHG